MPPRRRPRSAFGTLAVGGGLAAAVLSLLPHAAGYAGSFDRLSHVAPLFLAIGLFGFVLAVVGAVRPRGVLAAASVVSIIASGSLIVPEFTRDNGAGIPFDATRQIKVIQINAQMRNSDVRRVANWLIAQSPDVITVTEARHDLRDLLVRQGWKTAGAQGSLMIFTRERYVRMDRPPRPSMSKPTFVNATYRGPLGDMEIVTTHIDRGASNPIVQLRNLEAVVGALQRDRMILTGDFNLTPWSSALRRLDGSLGLIRRDRAVASWPAEILDRRWPWPLFPIDHVYAGQAWVTVKVERGPWVGSDHYPVVVTLAARR